MRVLRNSLPFAAAAAIAACGGGGASNVATIAPPTEVPSGVDTLVSARADSLANASFVEVPAQDEATELQEQGRLMVERTDSLWLAMAALID